MKRYWIFGLPLLFMVPLKAQVEKDDDFKKISADKFKEKKPVVMRL
jgi:hypothetical protein